MKRLILLTALAAIVFPCLAPLGKHTEFRTETAISDTSGAARYKHIATLISCQIWAESRGDSLAYNKKEQAAGLLQIRPVMIRGVNNILREQGNPKRFKLADRWSAEKSKEIWGIVMDARNPEYDIRKACLIWNGRGKAGTGSKRYYSIVQKQYKLKSI